MEYIDGQIDNAYKKDHMANKINIDKDLVHNLKVLMDISKKPEDVAISTMTITCKFNFNVEFFIENIGKYIDLNKNCINEVTCGKNICRSLLHRKKNKTNNSQEDDYFYNQVSMKIMTKKDKLINIKLFNNGSIQMTGCKSADGTVEALEKLTNMITKEKAIIDTKTFKLKEIPFVSDVSKICVSNITDYNIAMINSNFSIGFRIDRKKLFKKMLLDNVDVSFDSIIHAGVIARFNTGGKTTSILIFESGSIVITGAQSCDHINKSYMFINKYLLENYRNIVKSNTLTNATILKYLDDALNSD